MKYKIKQYYPEIGCALLCITLGMLSGLGINVNNSLWFINLHKPSFMPPNWIFGPVWTILYCLMGIALGKLWKERTQNRFLISLFTFQLILNLMWSPLFFYFHRIDLALYNIIVLWISLIMFMISTFKQRTIFFLFVPYILWVSFALFLNYQIYTINKPSQRDTTIIQ